MALTKIDISNLFDSFQFLTVEFKDRGVDGERLEEFFSDEMICRYLTKDEVHELRSLLINAEYRLVESLSTISKLLYDGSGTLDKFLYSWTGKTNQHSKDKTFWQ